MFLVPSAANEPPQNHPPDPKLIPWKVPVKALSDEPGGTGLSKVTVVAALPPVEGLVSVTERLVSEPVLTEPNAIDDGFTVNVGAVVVAELAAERWTWVTFAATRLLELADEMGEIDDCAANIEDAQSTTDAK